MVNEISQIKVDKAYLEATVKDAMSAMKFNTGATLAVLDGLNSIFMNEENSTVFTSLVESYRESKDIDFEAAVGKMAEVSERADIHVYLGNLIFLLSLTGALHERYKANNLSEEIYIDTIHDIKYKLIECELIKHVEGVFVPNWFGGFFRLTRFGLGRLQFEIVKLNYYHRCKNGFIIVPGQKAINMHIPRTETRLYHEEVLDSYRQAKEFFKDEFGKQGTVFTCNSWLLDPWHLEVLNGKSNLCDFIRDFEIINISEYENYNSTWRLFDMDFTGNIDDFPADTTLRRAYVEKMKNGEKTRAALGVFVM